MGGAPRLTLFAAAIARLEGQETAAPAAAADGTPDIDILSIALEREHVAISAYQRGGLLYDGRGSGCHSIDANRIGPRIAARPDAVPDARDRADIIVYLRRAL